MLIVFLPHGEMQHVKLVQTVDVLAMCHPCVIHKRAIIAGIIYAFEKTIYGLKKTIHRFEVIFAEY